MQAIRGLVGEVAEADPAVAVRGINHGGHRQLNAAIYRTVIVRMRFHQPTIDYVARRTAEGKTKREIIRCLKRYVIREVYHLLRPATQTIPATS